MAMDYYAVLLVVFLCFKNVLNFHKDSDKGMSVIVSAIIKKQFRVRGNWLFLIFVTN